MDELSVKIDNVFNSSVKMKKTEKFRCVWYVALFIFFFFLVFILFIVHFILILEK